MEKELLQLHMNRCHDRQFYGLLIIRGKLGNIIESLT